MTLTPELLAQAMGCRPDTAVAWAPALREACQRFQIDTPARLAAFIAQLGHESGSLRYTAELWGPTEAQKRYQGRKDLGNTRPGDGLRFKGHGPIQITGRFNHAKARDQLREALGPGVPDFEAEPEKLELPQWGAMSAANYWSRKGLNALADAGKFEAITRLINGGLNGLLDRKVRWEKAKKVLATSSAGDRGGPESQ